VGKSVAQIPAFWTVLKTVDAGQTWVSSTYSPSFNISSVYFINDTVGYIVGGSNTVLKTTDGGTNWISKAIGNPSGSYLSSVFFTDLNTGYIAAETSMGGGIFQTIDEGENWIYENVGDNSLLSIHFPAMDTGYVVGYLGDIFKTTNGGTPLGINKKPSNNINCIINPNPISSTSLIKYSLSHTSSVTIQILNFNGQVVQTLMDKKIQRGDQQITFDGSCLKPGVYFCTLQTDSEILTKRLIIE